MKLFKKALRFLVLTIVLILASVGVGFGAVLLPAHHRDDNFRANVEMVEDREEDDDPEEDEALA